MTAGAATLFGGSVYAYRSNSLEISHERLALTGVQQSLRIVGGDLISRLDFDWARSILDFSE